MTTPQIPRDALPSVRTLTRASVALLALFTLLVVGVVLPAETNRDPIGLGRVLGLADMGRIKVALAKKAADSTTAAVASGPVKALRAPDGWRDAVSITLAPNEGIEVKLAMTRGALATYAWRTDSAEVYFDMHGEPPNAAKDEPPHRYQRGSAVADSGTIVAAFDGVHGWFWRNRSSAPMTITLRTRGAYRELREIK